MTHTFKPGDKAMVTVDKTTDRGEVYLLPHDGSTHGYFVPQSCIVPMPVPDPARVAAERRVLDAVEAWVAQRGRCGHSIETVRAQELEQAYFALRALDTPPDPLAAVVATAKALVRAGQEHSFELGRRNADNIAARAATGEALDAATAAFEAAVEATRKAVKP